MSEPVWTHAGGLAADISNERSWVTIALSGKTVESHPIAPVQAS
jgi:hypothetical protein